MAVEWISAVAAAAGVIFGGSGKALFDSISHRADVKNKEEERQDSESTDYREELRRDILGLKAENKELRDTIEGINKKYYDLLKDYLVLKARTEQVQEFVSKS